MIQKAQHHNQKGRYEEWMLRENLDVPMDWSNDIVNISDQPYEPGYPMLGPIKRVRGEESAEGVFRFPTDGELGAKQIEQLIEKQGTDALAWYRPFHMDPQEKWGITILDQGIWYVANKIAEGMNYATGIEWTEDEVMHYRDIAKDFLYHHEMFHFKVELAATVMERINLKEPIYARYWNPQEHDEWFGSEVKSNRQVKAPLEEALANSYALHKVCSELSGNERNNVKNAIKNFMRSQPDGYKHAEKFPYNGKKWEMAMNELLDKLLNQDDSQEWAPQRILATHVLFDGLRGKDDWIEEYYEGIVPCRILDTGFAQGRFASSPINSGIFCISNKFKRDMKKYPNGVRREFEKSCSGFKKYTNGRGMENHDGYKEFSRNADSWSKAELFDISKRGTKVYYFRIMGNNGYRIYHERFEGEEVLLRTHKKTSQSTPSEIKNFLKNTPRPLSISRHDYSCSHRD